MCLLLEEGMTRGPSFVSTAHSRLLWEIQVRSGYAMLPSTLVDDYEICRAGSAVVLQAQ